MRRDVVAVLLCWKSHSLMKLMEFIIFTFKIWNKMKLLKRHETDLLWALWIPLLQVIKNAKINLR
jgi:hypothetical protein